MKTAGSNVRQSKGDRYTLEEQGSTFPIRIVRLRLPTSHHQVAYTYMQRAAQAQALDFVPFRCLIGSMPVSRSAIHDLDRCVR